jgi:hypothetical protein
VMYRRATAVGAVAVAGTNIAMDTDIEFRWGRRAAASADSPPGCPYLDEQTSLAVTRVKSLTAQSG